MILPVPGDPVLHFMPNSVEFIASDDFTRVEKGQAAKGDIPVGGWLTTESRNTYKQIVHTSTFDHPEGMTYWSGRILDDHGRRWLKGGGSNTPVGVMTEHSFHEGVGLRGRGHFYRENEGLFKRAITDGTLNAWSIGFKILDKGAEIDKKTDTLHITKGQLFEVSAVTIGANHDSFIELLHSMQIEESQLIHGYAYIIYGGERYLVNREGDLIDG